MQRLITPQQVVALAFADGEFIEPERIPDTAIAEAEQTYLLPVIGRKLYDNLLGGGHAAFTTDYIAPALACCIRLRIDPTLYIRRSQYGAVQPRSSAFAPADPELLRLARQTLRTTARRMLQRASDYLEAHADEFPEYDPERNILKRCTIHGSYIQIH